MAFMLIVTGATLRVLRVLAEPGPWWGARIADSAAMSRPCVYPILARLDVHDLITARHETSAERGAAGRALRRFYQLTRAGRDLLAADFDIGATRSWTAVIDADGTRRTPLALEASEPDSKARIGQTVRLRPDILRRVRAVAIANRTPISEALRTLIELGLQTAEAPVEGAVR